LHRLAATRAGFQPRGARQRTRWFFPIEQRENPLPSCFGRRAPPAEVADTMKTGWEHMLQEPAEELWRVQGEEFPRTGIALAILESGASLFFLEDTLGGERSPLHISSEVAQRFLTGADGFGVDDPFLLPDPGRHLCQKFGASLQGSH
jgi:hypothetical protein